MRVSKRFNISISSKALLRAHEITQIPPRGDFHPSFAFSAMHAHTHFTSLHFRTSIKALRPTALRLYRTRTRGAVLGQR